MFGLVAAGAFVVTLYVNPNQPVAGTDLALQSPSPEVLTAAGTPGGVDGMDVTDVSPEPVSPTVPPGDVGATSTSGLRAYALPLVELPGLPPDVAPGTRVELWVAWDPPVTERARVQKLFGGAQVGRVIPPVVAEAPTTIELLVPVKEFPELLFADRHGALSGAIVPE